MSSRAKRQKIDSSVVDVTTFMDEEDKKDLKASTSCSNIALVNDDVDLMANLGFKDKGTFSRIGAGKASADVLPQKNIYLPKRDIFGLGYCPGFEETNVQREKKESDLN